MPQITITDQSGQEKRVEAPLDRTLMEVIRENGFDDLLALCGGCCSCATCHVFVDGAFLDKLPSMSQDESDLLDTSAFRNESSRLSCQVQVQSNFSGMRVTIAPVD